MKTFVFTEHNGSVVVTLSGESYEEAIEYLESMLKNSYDFRCNNTEGEEVRVHLQIDDESNDRQYFSIDEIDQIKPPDDLFKPDDITTHPVLLDAIEGLKEAANEEFRCEVCKWIKTSGTHVRCMFKLEGRIIDDINHQPSWCQNKGDAVL